MAQHQGPRLVNKQFNSPIGLYSDNNIREIISRDSQLLSNGAVGIDFHNPMVSKPGNLQNSAVLRMLEEEENRQRNGHAPSVENGFHPHRQHVKWPPEGDISNKRHNPYANVKATGTKRVAWPPPKDASEDDFVAQPAVQPQGGPQYPLQSAPQQQNGAAAAPAATGATKNYHEPLSVITNPSSTHAQNNPQPQSPRVQTPTTPFKTGSGGLASPSKRWAPVASPKSPNSPQPKQPVWEAAPRERIIPIQQQGYAPVAQQGYSPVAQQERIIPIQQQAYPSVKPQPQGYSPVAQQERIIPIQQQAYPNTAKSQPQGFPVVQQYSVAKPVATNSPREVIIPIQLQGSGPSYNTQVSIPRETVLPVQRNQFSSGPAPVQEQHRERIIPIQRQSSTSNNPLTQSQNTGFYSPSESVQSQQRQQQPVSVPQQINGYSQQSPQQQPQYLVQSPPAVRSVEPPPSIITLRPKAPVSQAPAPVYASQPATATLRGGKNLRGDTKWPPEDVKERMDAENQARVDLAQGPACRPRRPNKDYSGFFAQHALNSTYPGYKIPPGTQFYDHHPVM